jgi:nucleotide-binding universal stress UspA family protein
MRTVNRSDIIVGFDGSPASERALRWAAREADLCGADLTIVYVYDRHRHEVDPRREAYAATIEAIARAVIDGAVATARSVAPDVPTHGLPLFGAAAATLVNASERRSTIVVGNRGRGGFRSLLLGSVSEQVATHAAGPVVVVRGRSDFDGPVVVGVDGSSSDENALAEAMAEAELRHTPVNAIFAHPKLDPTVVPKGPPYVEDDEGRRERFDPVMERLRERFPAVKVELSIVEGEAATALIDASTTAQLVVVGSRGHGGFAGLRLGSIGRHLLHHAQCPVMVLRPAEVGR